MNKITFKKFYFRSFFMRHSLLQVNYTVWFLKLRFSEKNSLSKHHKKSEHMVRMCGC